MQISVDALTTADATALADLDDYAFLSDPSRADRLGDLEELNFDQVFGVRGDEVPLRGVYTFYDITVAEPGPSGSVAAQPVAGLSWVAVHPDHRRQGVLSAMIAHHLRDARDRGYPWSALTATETAIYGRFGFGVATLDVRYTLNRSEAVSAPAQVTELAADVEVRTLLSVSGEECAARLHAIEEANASVVLGTITLPAAKTRGWLRDIPERRRGEEPLHAFVATRDGRDVGMAVFRRRRRDKGGLAEAVVYQFSYADDGVALALVRRLTQLDLVGKVKLGGRGLDDPPLWWSRGPRDLDTTVGDAVWLRVLDVEAALSRRGYGAPLDVVIEIADEVLPENAGRFRLRIDADGTARCTRTDDPADVSCAAADLGAVHLGLRGWRSLAGGGSVRAKDPSVLARLDAAFATGVAPIGGVGF